jgi:hypothetical protein
MAIKRPRGTAHINNKESGMAPRGQVTVTADPVGPPRHPHDDLREVIAIGNTMIWPVIKPHLLGRPPEIQAGILADVTALWLTAYAIEGDAAATADRHTEMLDSYIGLVQRLLDLNTKILDGHLAVR